MKKLIVMLIFVASLTSTFAGTVNLAWNAYTNSGVNFLKIYGVKGTNTVFLTNNSNATISNTVPVANTTFGVSNLLSGAWTFTMTALGTNGLESLNSNVVWTNVLPGAVVNLRVTGVTP
jgi:hypothetical protein